LRLIEVGEKGSDVCTFVNLLPNASNHIRWRADWRPEEHESVINDTRDGIR
jgi:hypothetical protein